MRIPVLLFFFTFFCSLVLQAQVIKKSVVGDSTVYTYHFVDTIHVRGTIQFPDGTPAKIYEVRSLNKQTEPADRPSAYTDNNGFFSLEYVEPTGKILIIGFNFADTIDVKGSRMLRITVPYPTLFKIDTTIQVFSQKTRPYLPDTVVYEKKYPVLMATDEGAYMVMYGHPVYGLEEFIKRVKENIQYPEEAFDKGVEGLVSISFCISDKGDPEDFIVLRGLGYGCEEVVIEAIKKTKWRSSFYPGGNPKERYTLNIDFNLRRM